MPCVDDGRQTKIVGDASNVAEDINGTPFFDDLLNSSDDFFFDGNVALDVEPVWIWFRRRWVAYIKSCYASSLGCEKGSSSSPNAITRASNDDHFVLEFGTHSCR